MSNDKLNAAKQIPDTRNLDNFGTGVKIGLGLVPGIGSTLSELINKSISLHVNARTSKWQESVVSCLEEIYQKFEGLPAGLTENETFITALLHGAIAATRTHQEEKLEALRNAVVNSALPNAPSDDLQLMFLNYVDIFTPWHLRMLKFFDNPETTIKQYKPNPKQPLDMLLQDIFPQLKEEWEFCYLVIKDLTDRRFISLSTMEMPLAISKEGFYSRYTTSLGQQFLNFVSSPITKVISN